MSPIKSSPAGQTPIAEALKENLEAAEAVEKAADDLAVVHAVLSSELSGDAFSPEAAQAVRQTERLQKQLTVSSRKLERVNDALSKALSTGRS